MNASMFYSVAISKELTTYHYKVLLLLMKSPSTQIQIANELQTTKQNINKVCRELMNMDVIVVRETCGRNKILAINSNPNVQIKGKIKT